MTQQTNFSRHILLSLIPYHCLVTIALIVYTITFINIPQNVLAKFIMISLGLSVTIQFVISPFIHKAVISQLINRLNYYYSTGLSPKERTLLIKKLLKYPVIKGIEILAQFSAGLVLCAIAYYVILDLSKSQLVLFYGITICASYTSFVITTDRTQKICNAEVQRIAQKGIDEEMIGKDHFYGLPLHTLFFLYIIIPMIICSFFQYMGIVFEYSNTKMLILSATNILLISFLSILFFRRLKNNFATMNKVLTSLIEDKSRLTDRFESDFASEISYTMYLLNKTIALFQSIMTNTAKINRAINESTINLSSVSTETASTSTEQYSISNEILTTMKSLDQNSTDIETKATEVMNVADKTAQQIDHSFAMLQQNLEKIDKIRNSNTITINGIQSLSNKLGAILEIVNLINSVTSQTKIIAFNAELEASSIKDSNNDFQGVALNIRSLADRTTKLTNDIMENINEIKILNNNLIETGHEFMEQINEGSALSTELEEKFNYIQSSALRTLTESRVVQTSVPEQTLAFKQIETALININEKLNELTGSSQQIPNTIAKLKTESEKIEKRITNISTGEEL